MSTKIYAIKHKATGQFLSCHPKVAWMSSMAAKNAFALHMRRLFSDQDAYEIVDLTEAYYRLEGLEK